MTDLELRRVTDELLPEVSALSMALYAEHPGPLPVDAQKVERTARHFAAHPERGGVYTLHEKGQEELLGYVIVANYWSNEYGGQALILDELYVAAGQRGRGIGRRLLEMLPSLDPEAKALLLEVDDDNPRARKLYESMGFALTGRHHLRKLC